MIVKKSQSFWKIKFFVSFLKLLMHFRFLISIGTPFHSLAPVYFMDFLPRVVFAFGVCKFCICLVSCEYICGAMTYNVIIYLCFVNNLGRKGLNQIKDER